MKRRPIWYSGFSRFKVSKLTRNEWVQNRLLQTWLQTGNKWSEFGWRQSGKLEAKGPQWTEWSEAAPPLLPKNTWGRQGTCQIMPNGTWVSHRNPSVLQFHSGGRRQSAPKQRGRWTERPGAEELSCTKHQVTRPHGEPTCAALVPHSACSKFFFTVLIFSSPSSDLGWEKQRTAQPGTLYEWNHSMVYRSRTCICIYIYVCNIYIYLFIYLIL